MIVRPTIGSELRTLVGVDSAGVYITPDYGRLFPQPHELYVTLLASQRPSLQWGYMIYMLKAKYFLRQFKLSLA